MKHLLFVIVLVAVMVVLIGFKKVESKKPFDPYFKVGEVVHLDHFDMENCQTIVTSFARLEGETVYTTSTDCGSPFKIVDYVSESEIRNGKMQANVIP